MSIVALLVGIAVLGFLAWLVMLIPMPETFKRVFLGIVVLVLIVCVLQQLGFLGSIPMLKFK